MPTLLDFKETNDKPEMGKVMAFTSMATTKIMMTIVILNTLNLVYRR